MKLIDMKYSDHLLFADVQVIREEHEKKRHVHVSLMMNGTSLKAKILSYDINIKILRNSSFLYLSFIKRTYHSDVKKENWGRQRSNSNFNFCSMGK